MPANFRIPSVNAHKFSMVPRSDVPRSSFRMQTNLKTTFNAGYLVPVYVDEVLPGDSFNLRMTAFCRLATPLFPVMDNVYLETFWFFVPNRLIWDNWKRFMGEQPNPGDSISFVVPQVVAPTLGYAIQSLQDYMGLPTVGQVSAAVSHNALPLRAYNLIYNEWFRDENLQNSVTVPKGDGPDPNNTYTLLRRGKRHDYFTSSLPWVQKGVSIPLPLGTTAPVTRAGNGRFRVANASGLTEVDVNTTGGGDLTNSYFFSAGLYYPLNPNLQVDLSSATAATINQIRQAFQIQKLLERDARGGTRYAEIIRSHFGVVSPDARLQRPEYLGGGRTLVNFSAVPQTSETQNSPQGNLAAFATAVLTGHGFTQSFTEHGYIIGLVNCRADLTYQQGLRKMWSRSTRYDFYFPVFAHLGEQAVFNREIYVTGTATDAQVFGYQERWAEYRYFPSSVTGHMRSTSATPLDAWHLAQRFTVLPTLSASFIQDNPPIDRVLAVQDESGSHFLADFFFDIRAARPLPLYSVPGLVDHF